jgi:hypothetical protein
LFFNLADQPYDAKYLLFVYGPKVYNDFIMLARDLTSATYQPTADKQADERSHTLFLLLMIILLFSNGFRVNSFDDNQSNISKLNDKLHKIQQNYIEIACRFLHDQFGLTVGRRMFQKLVPLLLGKYPILLTKTFQTQEKFFSMKPTRFRN